MKTAQYLIKTTFLTFLTTLALSPIAAADTAASSSLCDLSVEALKRASAVRGLALKNAVPCVVQDQAAVTNFIQTTIKEDLPAQKLELEEFAYKAIGLIPHNFDYQNKMVEFLVGQIGGYYDPKKKRFVMAGWLPASVQSSVAEHELTHALQDQYYDLGSIVNSKKATSDSGMAASALIEGDASAVMYDCQKAASGLGPLKDEKNIDALLLMQVLGIGFDGEVPESLKALLVFPYSSGLRFAHALLREGGYRRIDEAYKRVPTTSREILHPEDYLSGSFVAKIPDDSELTPSVSGASLEYTDVLGEFGISSLFRGAAITKDRGAFAAKGWVGDKLGVFKSAGDLRSIVWLTRWESEEDAKEFANLYREYAKVINLSSDKDANGVGVVSVSQVGSEVLVRPKI